MLDDAGRALVERHVNVAAGAARQYWRKAPRADLDELKAVAYAGLVQAVDRFPDYQIEHGYALDDHRYLVAFLDRRVKGALLDHARSQDWLTRSQRTKAKLLDAVAEQGAGSYAEQAGASGLTEDHVREVRAALASTPVHLEGERLEVTGLSPETSWGDSIPDPAPGTESTAVAGSIMSAMLGAIRGLPWEQQALLAWHYLRGRSLKAYARETGISEAEALGLHQAAVLKVHESMLAEAAEGCGCGRGGGSCGCPAR